MDTLSQLERFAAATREHIDLSVRLINTTPPYVQARNRFSATLTETVTCTDKGVFITSWGYRLGTTEDVESAAARLAYLMAALPA